MTKKPLTFEEFKTIYSKVPRLTVEVIVKTDKGILFTKRLIPPYVGSWHFPGGTVYYKETITDAIERVAQDELGVKVTTPAGSFSDCVKIYEWSPIDPATAYKYHCSEVGATVIEEEDDERVELISVDMEGALGVELPEQYAKEGLLS